MTTSGPKGVSALRPVEPREQRQAEGQERFNKPSPKASPDAVVSISSRAAELGKWMTSSVQGPELDRLAESYDVDSRKTAEAIMKRLVPELYQALVEAGEVEE